MYFVYVHTLQVLFIESIDKALSSLEAVWKGTEGLKSNLFSVRVVSGDTIRGERIELL